MSKLSDCPFRSRAGAVHARETQRISSMSEGQLGEAIREVKLPKVCRKHPKAIWFDEDKCPACRAESEFLSLTDNFNTPTVAVIVKGGNGKVGSEAKRGDSKGREGRKARGGEL